MIKVPAHKQTDPKKKPGQIIHPVPSQNWDDHPAAWPFPVYRRPDQTLDDYIKRKQQEMDQD